MNALNCDLLYTKDWKLKSTPNQTQADEEIPSNFFSYITLIILF